MVSRRINISTMPVCHIPGTFCSNYLPQTTRGNQIQLLLISFFFFFPVFESPGEQFCSGARFGSAFMEPRDRFLSTDPKPENCTSCNPCIPVERSLFSLGWVFRLKGSRTTTSKAAWGYVSTTSVLGTLSRVCFPKSPMGLMPFCPLALAGLAGKLG